MAYTLVENSEKMGGIPLSRRLPKYTNGLLRTINFKVSDGENETNESIEVFIPGRCGKSDILRVIDQSISNRLIELNDTIM